MKKLCLLACFAFAFFVAAPAHADSCGIGRAVEKFNNIDNPSIGDFRHEK